MFLGQCFAVSIFIWGSRKMLREEMIERKGQWTGCPFLSDTGDCKKTKKREKEQFSGRKREEPRLEVKV